MTGARNNRLRRGAVALLLAALALAAGGCGGLSNDELKRGVESLGALAGQGRLVAEGVAQDETKATYARAMARTLGEEAEHEAEKLADATLEEPELGGARQGAIAIATEIADQLSEVQTFPGDERRAAAARRHLVEAQEQADALAERLSRDSR